MADQDAYWSVGAPAVSDTEAFWRSGAVYPPTKPPAVAGKARTESAYHNIVWYY